MSTPVRVRFAPSPTGPLHIGGIRTALFNYLFAKKNKGKFILRIEDTDRNRYVAGAEEYIIEALEWCGIPYDEGPGKDGGYGPYRQSERKHLYGQYAEQLVKKGHAYYAFDTPETLEHHRKDHEAKGKTFIYNAHNRLKLTNSMSLPTHEVDSRLESGESFVIRFKTPEETLIKVFDLVRGEIEVDSRTLDDKILFKSDGMPTYHLANIVDDHLMEISHVIRGEEWLPSLALHQQLYDAFGWQAPHFAHLPLIMKPTGKGKLSKRDGEKMGFPVFPISWEDSIGFREAGYYPEAVINFLALLGWNPGTEQEVFSMAELITAFDLDRVHKAGARFDPEKTKWFNQQYLQQRSSEVLLEEYVQALDEAGVAYHSYDKDSLGTILSLVRERAEFVKDLVDQSGYFFNAPDEYAPKALKRGWKEGSDERLRTLLSRLKDSAFSRDEVESEIKAFMEDHELNFGAIMPTLRLVLVGDLKGPGVFDIMAVLGREEVLRRIENALQRLA